jgi:vacuolar protein sorting-associated protein 13A/C
MKVNPIKLNVSLFVPPDPDSITQQPLKQLLGAFVDAIPNLDTPLTLNALELENAFGPRGLLISKVYQHYISQAIRGSYKLLGSMDFVGNPVSVISGVGSGFKALFYEPAQGVADGPAGFFKGNNQKKLKI